MKNFADNRPSVVKDHIKNQFNLPNDHPITISNPAISEGYVEVNENLNIQESSWTGDYFETVPIQLTAIAASGYEFSHWSGDISSTDQTISISLVGAFEVTPNFTPAQTLDPIVINEINYKSSDDFNADDWVELYNPNTSAVDLSNWQIKDDDDSHVFTIPSETSIDAEGYLVFVKDASDFSEVFPQISYIGEIDFGFGSSDAVRLFDQNGTPQDEVYYQSDAPWPDCADETGDTLELISPELDNSLPENWDCINPNGSPNAINNGLISVDDISMDQIKIYPNPVQRTLYISGLSEITKIEVYSVMGQRVLIDYDSSNINVSQLSQGLYYLTLSKGNQRTHITFIKTN